MLVAVATATTLEDHYFLPFFQKRNFFARTHVAHNRTDRKIENKIITVLAVKTVATAVTATLCEEFFLMAIFNENMHVANSTYVHVSTVTTVTARRTGKFLAFFVLPTLNAVSAVARFHINTEFVDKCHKIVKSLKVESL